MTRLPPPPKLVPHQSDLSLVAPAVQRAVEAVLASMREKGWKPRVFETLRTLERQAYLHGFGRLYDEYDDKGRPRGIVTKVQDARSGWHFYGLAVDIVEDDRDPWVAPLAFWNDLGTAAEANGLAWGGRWKDPYDAPHIQWGGCRRSPSKRARELYAQGGAEAVWREVGAL